jgi:hypothetical protein
VLRDLPEYPVAALAGLIDIPRFQREPESLGRCIRLVDGKVAPPHAAIVPKVMVRILLVHSQRELGFAFHAFYCLGIGLNKRFSDEEVAFWDAGVPDCSGLSSVRKDIC